jgi:Asp-tRNA(Asn)/Glu-tRNA(Gln) amidotransferase A subunit family amidase
MPRKGWQSIAKEAQEYRDTTILQLAPPAPHVPDGLPKNVTILPEQLLDPSVLAITDLPPKKLIESLVAGHLSAVNVTAAFLQRAAVAQGLTNCITELLADRAMRRAKELDALIALHGSCLGIGSDVGGSVRSPAANCGLYGLKPTAFRLPTDGWGYMMTGADTVETVLGPLSSSLDGLKIFMKTIIDAEPWLTEPALVPMP